ncbi:conserved hypothetical protein [Paenibacillus curdlanolyticus YK9]|uniref:Hydrolase n=1 Tax=Paenibacillus curdlanolyticus YK9 TaxID=717606 RepID=E0IDQ0_9BACL|nr:hypothetical protein [Paenibacillus curdlanolyticus]EFM09254.1 conserved hypothetical protein [Paenibacillus curdlanolyticus YK9]
MPHIDLADDSEAGERKLYYVSVAAGQVLDDPEAAAYELVINANREEVNRLKTLFNDYSSMDEAQAFHFVRNPYETTSDAELNGGTDEIIVQIYRLLRELGTEETKRFLTSNRLGD